MAIKIFLDVVVWGVYIERRKYERPAMNDAVKRLRACKTYEQGDAPAHMKETTLGKKAADEIERLHKELGEATEYGADTLQQLLNATTENEQLRVKLKELETGK